MENINDILEDLKGDVTSQKIQKLKNIVKQQDIQSVRLWKMKSQIKILFKGGKYQAYLLAFAGLFLLPYTMYQKYVEQPQKITKIVIFTPIAFTVCLAPLYFFNRYTKTLLTSLSYQFKSNSFELTKFKGNKLIVKPTELNLKLNKKGRIVTLQNCKDKQVSQIQGLGEWKNIDLFKHIVTHHDL